jgi:hypothetical protein
MKTPIQELIDTFEEMRSPIDSKVDVDFAISLVISMLEKEKEAMCEFAWEYERDCRINLERSIEKCWDKIFKTKEK